MENEEPIPLTDEEAEKLAAETKKAIESFNCIDDYCQMFKTYFNVGKHT